MINIRGVNVYPAGIEAVVRQVAEVVEFRSTVSRPGALRSLRLEIELTASCEPAAVSSRLAANLRDAIGMTVPITIVDAGTLPRFEMKASRFIVEA